MQQLIRLMWVHHQWGGRGVHDQLGGQMRMVKGNLVRKGKGEGD